MTNISFQTPLHSVAVRFSSGHSKASIGPKQPEPASWLHQWTKKPSHAILDGPTDKPPQGSWSATYTAAQTTGTQGAELLEQGFVATGKTFLERSLALWDMLLQGPFFKDFKRPPTEVTKSKRNLALAHMCARDFSQAEALLRSALEDEDLDDVPLKPGDKGWEKKIRALADTLLVQAIYLNHTGQHDPGAIDFKKAIGADVPAIEALEVFTKEAQAKLAEAETLYDAALMSAKKNGGLNRSGVAWIYTGLGAIAKEKGNYILAHNYLQESLRLLDKKGEKGKNDPERARTLEHSADLLQLLLDNDDPELGVLKNRGGSITKRIQSMKREATRIYEHTATKPSHSTQRSRTPATAMEVLVQFLANSP